MKAVEDIADDETLFVIFDQLFSLNLPYELVIVFRNRVKDGLWFRTLVTDASNNHATQFRGFRFRRLKLRNLYFFKLVVATGESMVLK